MDPISVAIVAVLTAGLTNVGKQAVMDTYEGLKSLLKKKFGNDSKVVKAVDDLEEEKDSKGRQLTLQEQIAKAKADQDQELVQKAQELLNQIKRQPGGEQRIQSIVGNYNAQVYGSGSASVNVNHSKEA
jgi:disulfide oxidoreductase YuzD